MLASRARARELSLHGHLQLDPNQSPPAKWHGEVHYSVCDINCATHLYILERLQLNLPSNIRKC